MSLQDQEPHYPHQRCTNTSREKIQVVMDTLRCFWDKSYYMYITQQQKDHIISGPYCANSYWNVGMVVSADL